MEDIKIPATSAYSLVKVLETAFELEEIAKLAYSDPRLALDLVSRRAAHMPWLHSAVVTLAGHNIRTSGPYEKDIRQEFYDNLDKYLPGAYQTKSETTPGHIPDGFVFFDGHVCPVEIKRHKFDGTALKQLLRYMKNYDSPIGIAVAPELACPLPQRINFIKIELTTSPQKDT